MDIMDGTVKIGDDTRDIFSGHVFYLIRGGQMLVLAFMVDEDDSGGQDKNISLLKLWAKTQRGDSLPLSDSDSSLKLDILSPQSKLVSEYFLDMAGQLTFGGSVDDEDNEPNPQPTKGAEIVTSADGHGKKFFGNGAVQVVISDKNADEDEITVSIKAEGDGNDTVNITIPDTKDGSKKFEFFMVHANADCDDGSCIEKPLTVGSLDDEQVVTFGYGGELDTADEEFDEMSFTITYGDKKVVVEHKETLGSVELDRTSYGSDSTVHLFINDQDANLDPSDVDKIVVQENNIEELFALDEEITLPDYIEFTETTNNTAKFEAVLQINDEDSDVDEAEIIIDEGTGPFLIELLDVVDYDDLESDANGLTEIDSVSFNIDNKDGSIVKGEGDITFSSELEFTIKDSDQNKDSAKVDVLRGALTVEIEDGDSEELDLRETSANSGEFAIDNANKQLALTFTDDESPEDDNGLLEFTSNEIEDDIVITYSDPLNEDGADEEMQLELQLTTKAGSIELPSLADIDGDLAVTITDADMNDDVNLKESYTFTLTGDEPVPLLKADINLDDYAALKVRFNNDNADFDNAETYTLLETGVNTGVFVVSIDMVELAESAGVENSLEDGDTIEFTFLDRMEEPDEEDSDTAELDQ
jgi:hypothetical protein